MVQVLTDLDLVISKSYISSDGGWLMDVFHVTDPLGNKITDESLIHYIQQVLCVSRRESKEVSTSIGRDVRPRHVLTEHTALEMTGTDRPGLMSEISAVLAELGCHVSAAVAWTHCRRVACIIYVEDESKSGPISDPCRVAQVQAQLENVVEAHHCEGERRSVRLAAPAVRWTHTERRLHQLMAADRDYEECGSSSCGRASDEDDSHSSDEEANGKARWHRRHRRRNGGDGTHVRIENCQEKEYWIVTVRCRDRQKLLFDTLCALTDMHYIVFHAAITSMGSTAFQEYYIRRKDGSTLDPENEKRRVTQCLIAAVERRVSHGLRLDVQTKNRTGLLSDVTRIFRENGLSITRAEIGTRDDSAVGTFYVTDALGQNLNPGTVEALRQEIGGTIRVVDKSSGCPPQTATPGISRKNTGVSRKNSSSVEERSKLSLGGLLWSQLERLSSNFRPVKS